MILIYILIILIIIFVIFLWLEIKKIKSSKIKIITNHNGEVVLIYKDEEIYNYKLKKK